MTNDFNYGKDLMLDFLGCANLLWSTHTIKAIDFPPVVWALIPSIRASLKGKKIPSEDGMLLKQLIFRQNIIYQKIQKFLMLI
jgi:hypothetical protein